MKVKGKTKNKKETKKEEMKRNEGRRGMSLSGEKRREMGQIVDK